MLDGVGWWKSVLNMYCLLGMGVNISKEVSNLWLLQWQLMKWKSLSGSTGLWAYLTIFFSGSSIRCDWNYLLLNLFDLYSFILSLCRNCAWCLMPTDFLSLERDPYRLRFDSISSKISLYRSSAWNCLRRKGLSYLLAYVYFKYFDATYFESVSVEVA